VDGVLKTTQQVGSLAQDRLQNLTRGNSYARITPQVGWNEDPIQLAIYNTGSQPLTGITINMRKALVTAENPDPWGKAGGPQVAVGTLSSHEGRMLPFTISPVLGQNETGIDAYEFTISAQNKPATEWLWFRKGQKVRFAYKEQVIRQRQILKVGKNSYKYIYDHLIDCDWSDDPKTPPCNRP
jgi:hypothetical protein